MKKKKKWGNSYLAVNVKHWDCAYCGLALKDRKVFEITLINGNPLPYILCTPFCEKMMVKKIELRHRND